MARRGAARRHTRMDVAVDDDAGPISIAAPTTRRGQAE